MWRSREAAYAECTVWAAVQGRLVFSRTEGWHAMHILWVRSCHKQLGAGEGCWAWYCCVRVLQEDDGEQVLLTYKLMRVRMLILSSWLWVTVLHRKLFCACGCLSSYCSCFLLRSALLLRWSKCVFKTGMRKAWGSDGTHTSCLWTAALGLCCSNGLRQWSPNVLMNPPARLSSLQGAHRWLLRQSVQWGYLAFWNWSKAGSQGIALFLWFCHCTAACGSKL